MNVGKSTTLLVPALVAVTSLTACSDKTVQAEASTNTEKQINFVVNNASTILRADQTVVLTAEQITALATDFNFSAFTLYQDKQEVPSQAIDNNADGQLDGLVFNHNFAAEKNTPFTIKYQTQGLVQHNYPQRAHAELSINQGGKRDSDGKFQGGEFVPVKFQQIPEGHKPGDLQFRYEGPGWESDKIAFRLYFDHRNVNDIFGKKVPDMILPEVGHIGYSYHKPAPWGMDILKVGPSLGIGGVGMIADNKVHRVETASDMTVNIVEQGPVRAHIQIKHNDWALANNKFDLTSDLTINAGSRLTHNQLTISNSADNLVTGIVKHQPSEFISSDSEGDWAYIATFGKQSYVHDEMGMMVFYRKSNLIELSEDQHNYLVVMKPVAGKVDYYFGGTWAQDVDGINTKQAFVQYLEQTLAELNQPVTVKL